MTPSTIIPSMTVAQARHALHERFMGMWSEGDLPHEVLLTLGKLADQAVDALIQSASGDDLALRDEPLETISGALVLPLAAAYNQGVTPGANDLAVAVYEALIDDGWLPGVNAQRVGEPDDQADLVP